MRAAESVIDLIGHTPLVRLDRVGRDLACHFLAKLEYLIRGQRKGPAGDRDDRCR